MTITKLSQTQNTHVCASVGNESFSEYFGTDSLPPLLTTTHPISISQDQETEKTNNEKQMAKNKVGNFYICQVGAVEIVATPINLLIQFKEDQDLKILRFFKYFTLILILMAKLSSGMIRRFSFL